LKRLAFVLMGLALMASALGASYLRVNTDNAVIGGTTGRAFAWFTNTGDEKLYVSVSAELNELNGYFDDFYDVVKPGEAAGFDLYYSAPDCLEGFQDVFVKAEACTESGACTRTYEERFRVQVYAADSCRVMIDGNASYEYFEEGVAGAPAISYSRYFDPTEVSARVDSPHECVEIEGGDWARVPFTLYNEGAAASFDFSLVGDKEDVNAVLSNNYVSLNRNNAADLFVDVSPSRVRAGRYWVTLQTLFDGVVVAENDFCFDVLEDRSAEITLQSFVETSNCGPSVVRGVAQNTGVRTEHYSFELPEFASIQGEIRLEPGEKEEFEILLDSEKMAPGYYDLEVAVSTFDGDVSGVGTSTVLVKPCSGEELEVEAGEENEFLKLVVEVENPSPAVMQNVSVGVEGLPESWSVLASEAVDVPAESTVPVTLWVKPGSGDAEEAKVVVSSNGGVIAEKELETLEGSPSGLTGFVTLALSQNALFIAALVLIALLVIVLTGRKEEELEGQQKLEVDGESVEEKPKGEQKDAAA
jgi:hypothetical protein